MGTGRTLNKKPITRPKKSEGDRRRRQKAQKARLAKLGMDANIVAKMEPLVVRTMLQNQKKVIAALQAAAAKKDAVKK